MREQDGGEIDYEELLRTVRTNRRKALRFEGETKDGSRVTWYTVYRGKFGWSACRETGEHIDNPSDKDVKAGLREYENVDLVDLSETPEAVTL